MRTEMPVDETIDAVRSDELRRLIEEMFALASTLGDDVADAVRLAAEFPLPDDRARRMYTRILVMLRSGSREPDEREREALAAAVRHEVDELVGGGRPSALTAAIAEAEDELADHGDEPIGLVPYNGLTPHQVAPVPEFNGKKIAVYEGYVDVTTLSLWKGNHRVELAVAEFADRNGRAPDHSELLGILQGEVILPSLAKRDPFQIVPLARSIARKGVERPPIVTWSGEPKDGNRRIAAAMYVLDHPEEFGEEDRERARWIRVWRCPQETTEDQIEAIVVALNFEKDHKIEWEEYIKARLVAERYEEEKTGLVRVTQAATKRVREAVARHFAIKPAEVTRYLKMVDWATDFEQYHVEEQGRDEADVRYRANDIFQWFYEIDAGVGNEKLTRVLDSNDELKEVVYDLVFDVLDSGAQVRALHKVVADDDATAFLAKAHDTVSQAPRSDRPQFEEARERSLDLVKDAIEEVNRKSKQLRKTRLSLDSWLRGAVDKFGSTPPDYWRNLDTDLLTNLQRVLTSSLGIIEGELKSRVVK
jgi:hypothetical protein